MRPRSQSSSTSAARDQRSVPAAAGSAGAASVDLGRFRVSATSFSPCRLPRHYHDRACISIVLSGAFTERFGSRSVECVPAGVLAKPAGERHDDVMHGSRQIIVEPDAGAEDAWPSLRKVIDGISYHRCEVAGAVAARIETELATGDAFTSLSVEGLTLELFATLLRRSAAIGERGATPPWLERVRERLEYDRTVTTISELAAIAGVHPAYMARRFRHHFATSVGQYARRVRLRWAAQRLATTDDPVSSIALQAGFADQSHFTRAFRAYSGLTPRRYRLATRTGS